MEKDNRLLTLQGSKPEDVFDLMTAVAGKLSRVAQPKYWDHFDICCQADVSKMMPVHIFGERYFEDIRRLAYLLKGYPIGEGLEVVNSCSTIDCINHLKLVPQNPRRFRPADYERHAQWGRRNVVANADVMQATIPQHFDERRLPLLRQILAINICMVNNHVIPRFPDHPQVDDACQVISVARSEMLTFEELRSMESQQFNQHMRYAS